MPNSSEITYQLHILVHRSLQLRVGALGSFEFPAGEYLYTGSARRNLEARIARHLRRDKPLRWHIDYLLTAEGVRVMDVTRSDREECALNQAAQGRIWISGFGASDCRAGCGGHLKFLG